MAEEREKWPVVGAEDEAEENDVDAHQLGGDRDQLGGDRDQLGGDRDAAVLGEDGAAE